jgi:hypothetical protein
VDEGGQQRAEKAEGRKPNPEQVDDERSTEILPDDVTGASSDPR